MKASCLVLLVVGAAFAASEDPAPKEPKARQLAAPQQPVQFGARLHPQGYSQAAYSAYNGYPSNFYYSGAPAQAFANAPYYSGSYSAAPASYYPGSYSANRGAYYSGSYSAAPAGYYPGSYSAAPASYNSGAYSAAPASYYPGSYSANRGAYYSGSYSAAPAGYSSGAYSAPSQFYSGPQFAPKNALRPAAYSQSVVPAPAPVLKAAAPVAAAPAHAFAAAPAPVFAAAPVVKASAPLAPGVYAAQPNSVILKQNFDNNFDGSFTSSYETDQGLTVDSTGYVKNAGSPDEVQVMQGSYSYLSPEGVPIVTSYIADEFGFQVQGDHLPQPQALPEAIAKSLAYQASLPAQPEEVAAPSAPAPEVILAKKAL